MYGYKSTMKRANTLLIIILLMMEGCTENRKAGNESDNFITVNVRASYPKKKIDSSGFYGCGIHCAGNL
jgi:hypothetical protein